MFASAASKASSSRLGSGRGANRIRLLDEALLCDECDDVVDAPLVEWALPIVLLFLNMGDAFSRMLGPSTETVTDIPCQDMGGREGGSKQARKEWGRDWKRRGEGGSFRFVPWSVRVGEKGEKGDCSFFDYALRSRTIQLGSAV